MTDSTPAVPLDDTSEKLGRDEYFAERKLLIEARQGAYQRTDQMVLGGATGALLLSITFLEQIAPSPSVIRPDLLIAAWLSLLGCLSVRLAGQYFSACSFDCEIERLNARQHDETEPKNQWAKGVRIAFVVGSALLVTGIGLLARFAYLNAPFR